MQEKAICIVLSLFWLGVSMSGAAGADGTADDPASDRPPNIILVMADDLGIGNLGCYGSRAIRTPNLDRMAAEGMRFTNAYSGCVVCAPARSVLMTGMHMGHTSVRVNSGGVPLLDADVTIAELLRQRGYVCGGFGKWGLGDLATEGAPERQGFEEFFGFYHQFHAHLTYPEYLIDTGRKVEYPANRGFHVPFGGERPAARFAPELNPETGLPLRYAHYEIFERMKAFIRANRQRPFFCYAPWTPPHGRYLIPETDPAAAEYRDQPWSATARVFAAMTSMIDRQMGELFALLRELEIDDRTIVFFCSDHGPVFRFDGELDASGPYRGFKRSMYEGGLRVPLLVRWPGKVPAGSTSEHVCYFGDFFLTVCEIAGIDQGIPEALDSVSFWPALLGQPERQAEHEYLYWEWSIYNWRNRRWGNSMSAVRQGDWKIVRHRQDQPWELYDLAADPLESTDLAPGHPEQVAELAALAERARRPPRPQIEPDKPEGQRFR